MMSAAHSLPPPTHHLRVKKGFFLFFLASSLVKSKKMDGKVLAGSPGSPVQASDGGEGGTGAQSSTVGH